MRRYRFEFEAVLRARRAQEDLARQELARANHALRAAREVLGAELDRHRRAAPHRGAAPLETFRADQDAAALRAAVIDGARRRVDEADDVASVRLSQWTEAARVVAAFERLDERRREEWRVEALRAEVAAVDDITSSRWIAEERDTRRASEESS